MLHRLMHPTMSTACRLCGQKIGTTEKEKTAEENNNIDIPVEENNLELRELIRAKMKEIAKIDKIEVEVKLDNNTRLVLPPTGYTVNGKNCRKVPIYKCPWCQSEELLATKWVRKGMYEGPSLKKHMDSTHKGKKVIYTHDLMQNCICGKQLKKSSLIKHQKKCGPHTKHISPLIQAEIKKRREKANTIESFSHFWNGECTGLNIPPFTDETPLEERLIDFVKTLLEELKKKDNPEAAQQQNQQQQQQQPPQQAAAPQLKIIEISKQNFAVMTKNKKTVIAKTSATNYLDQNYKCQRVTEKTREKNKQAVNLERNIPQRRETNINNMGETRHQQQHRRLHPQTNNNNNQHHNQPNIGQQRKPPRNELEIEAQPPQDYNELEWESDNGTDIESEMDVYEIRVENMMERHTQARWHKNRRRRFRVNNKIKRRKRWEELIQMRIEARRNGREQSSDDEDLFM